MYNNIDKKKYKILDTYFIRSTIFDLTRFVNNETHLHSKKSDNITTKQAYLIIGIYKIIGIDLEESNNPIEYLRMNYKRAIPPVDY
jgi:hypothetical protein